MILLAVTSFANASNVFAGKWPLLPEGKSGESGQIWGELPNGLLYAVVPSDSASEAVSLRLMVAAGRAQEEKGRAGVSELLVEMAKFGTKNVSQDQLMRFKLVNGMDPQSHSFTEVDLNQTIYRFDLEEPRPRAVEASLGILYEMATAPLFDEVVFEEVKARLKHTAQLGGGRFDPKQAAIERVLLRSSPYSEMSDADVEAAMDEIKLADLESYWAKWYKADRMVLVVAGVVDPVDIEALIKSRFSSLAASEEAVSLMSKDGRFRSGGDLEIEDTPSSTAGLWITSVSEVGDLFTASAEQDFYVLDFIGRVAQSYASESRHLQSGVLNVHGDKLAISVSRKGGVPEFPSNLLAADKAVHRLAKYGVAAEDLEWAKAEYLSLRYSYDEELSAKEWAPLVADRVVRSVLDKVPFRYGKELSGYLQRVVAGITYETVRDRCMQLFREKSLSYYIELPLGFPLKNKAIAKQLKGMRKSYDFTWERAGETDQNWNFGRGIESSGMVESTEIIRFEEYPVLKYEFANNLRMNLIRSDAFQGRIQMMVSFGNGSSGLENANPAFEATLRTLMLKTKIGQAVESPTITEVLEAKGVEDIKAGLTKDHLYWSGVGRDASDVEDFFSVVLLWLVTGNLNEEDYDDEIENLEKLVERSMDKNSTVELDMLLYQNDDRLRSYFRSEDVDALDFASMQRWLSSVRENAYIEVTVVGDVMPRTVLRDVRKSFGSVPARTGKVMQPRHGNEVKWNEPGVVQANFKMTGSMGNITLLFPQVADKSCAVDRIGSVFLPLFEAHLRRALAGHPALTSNLLVESTGHQMIPLSNAIKVRVLSSKDEAEDAEALLLEAARSFEASLSEALLVAAERNALLGLKRIARSQSALIGLFKQSQGKPRTLGCVLDLLENGFGLSFEEYKDIAARQFSEQNVRGVSLMPAK